MFIIATSVLDPITGDVFFSFRAGGHPDIYTHTGRLKNATRLQGYLAAISGGLALIEACYIRADVTFLDVLVVDEQIAAQIAKQKSPPSRVLHSDDDPFWAEYFKLKRNIDVKIVSRIPDSPSISAVWSWSAVPPLPAFAPKSRAESDKMLAETKAKN